MPVRKEKHPPKPAWSSVVKVELLGLVIIVFSIIGLLESGWLGKNVLAYLFRFLAGSWDFVLPLLLIGVAIHMMFTRKMPHITPQLFGCLLVLLGILLWDHLVLYKLLTANGRFLEKNMIVETWELLKTAHSQKVSTTGIGGGMVGAVLFTISNGLLGMIGTGLIIILLFLVGIMFVLRLSYVDIVLFIRRKSSETYGKIKDSVKDSVQLLQEDSEKRKQKARERAEKLAQEAEQAEVTVIEAVVQPVDQAEEEPQADDEIVQPPVIRDFTERVQDDFVERPDAKRPMDEKAPGRTTAQAQSFSDADDALFQDLSLKDQPQAKPYIIPNLTMLQRLKAHSAGKETDLQTNADKLVQTLKSFGVQATVSEVHRGPAVTRYEVQPATGVKVSRIVSLTDDLALALAAKDIRIEAPIPGKSAIGIEVPNAEVAVVTLREVLESGKYKDASAKLTTALGRDISGEPIVADLAKMPHLLVAGATGSGKSVCINGLIMSILFKASPDEVKLMMIDPKMVELNVYNGIPHLLAPVVTDPRRASVALKKVVSEMERRYNLFAKNGARNIEMYNQLLKDQGGTTQPLPYIVVIVDELADLMMVAPGEVEDAICRLAQMARAAGIHLIIATQRPSVDVITGVIKANIPSRIAFGVSSMADSRTILDMGGAEKLLGRGDMLYLPMGASKPVRVQGAFVSDKEVEEVVRFVKEQQEVTYQTEMIPEEGEEETKQVVDDELFDQAVQIVVEGQTASASLLQRRLRIGYTRAARLIDMMEAQGIVGPYEGSKPREVRVPRPNNMETHIS
ncbi:MAG: DNA translocase FtsK [Clostridia bacterium]